jgi:hypothetical protein
MPIVETRDTEYVVIRGADAGLDREVLKRNELDREFLRERRVCAGALAEAAGALALSLLLADVVHVAAEREAEEVRGLKLLGKAGRRKQCKRSGDRQTFHDTVPLVCDGNCSSPRSSAMACRRI